REVSLVVLNDRRNPLRIVPVLHQVLIEVLQRSDVRVHAIRLRVGDEDDAVHALQDEPPARVVVYLARDRIEMESRLEAANVAQVDGKEVEEERALRFRRQRDQLAPGLRVDLVVDVLEVRALATQT